MCKCRECVAWAMSVNVSSMPLHVPAACTVGCVKVARSFCLNMLQNMLRYWESLVEQPQAVGSLEPP